MARSPLKSLFCGKYGCRPEDFEKRVFWKCLYWQARVVAPFIQITNPAFFQEDFKFIRYLGDSTGLHEVKVDALNFNEVNRGDQGFLRTAMNIRVSGRKASRLAARLFREASQAAAERLGQAR